MTLTCASCNKVVEISGDAWPGDVVTCSHCGADIHLPKAQTVSYATNTPLVALSPQGGDFRPQTVGDDEVLPPGALLGQYRIDKFVGRGGMGSVYKATHAMLQRTVAVKVLPPKFARDPEFVQRFKREALALAELSHPNIVAIHDMGQQGDIYFFVMEFVEGANLRDLLVAKKIPPEEALKIVPQLCEALEYAHTHGIIHRDIKPENIMLDRHGQAKVADFGLAKIVKGETATGALTQTNVVMGTLEYMAPEQRDSLKRVDHRADIYSMGVVLYEMLTGELPIGRFEPPSRKVTIDVRVDDVVLKALEHEPDRRYQRASHLGTDVSQVRVSKAPPRELPIMDLVSGKGVGTAVGRALAIRCGDVALRVDAWEQEEIGVRADGGYLLQSDLQPPVLQAKGDTESIAVFVPRGFELDIVARDEDVTVVGVSGKLAARVNDGGFTGNDLAGRVSVTAGDGDIAIVGLKGESIDLCANDGSITVSRLHLVRGQASIAANDGDVDVSLAPECSLRYQIHSNDGEISYPPGGTGGEKSAAGTIGQGGAQLAIRTNDGSATLRTDVKAEFNAAMLRDIGSSLTRQQVEKIGVFAIVNVALWAFFLGVAGTPIPALIVTVFWGMSLALEIWKGYVRGTAAGAPAASASASAQAAQAATAVLPPRPVPTTVPVEAGKPGFNLQVEVNCATSAPPAPTFTGRRRMSVLSVFAVIASTLALLLAVGVGLMPMIGGAISESDSGNYWVTYAALSFASLLVGIGSAAFGLASFQHVKDAGGALYGRSGAFFAFAVGIVAIALPYWRGYEAVDDAGRARQELHAIGRVAAQSFEDGQADPLWRLVSPGRDMTEESFKAEHGRVRVRLHNRSRDRGTPPVHVSPDLRRGRVSVYLAVRSGGSVLGHTMFLRVQRVDGEWRIVNMDEEFRRLVEAR